ncbi:MAG: WG repeat-containing protein [Cytophagales bacterium]|nr:WG repeat-containing protein [Bernardetiaceae bacterium]MDW8205339.1 WG repeat-containing protein [Cytophagales bacterium]
MYFAFLLLTACLPLFFTSAYAQRKPPKDAGTLPAGVNRNPAPSNPMRRNAPVFPEVKKPLDSAALAGGSAGKQTSPLFEKRDSAFISAIGGNLFIIRQQNLEGIANDTGKILLAPAYDRISFFNNKDSTCTRWEGILKVEKGGAVGLLHYTGKPITVLDYQDISLLPASCFGTHAASMVAKVKQWGKFGLINGKGEVLIRPGYDDVTMLTDQQGKATHPEVVVVRKQNKYGMMDLRNGNVLKTEFERIEFLQHLEKKEGKGKMEKELLLRLKINGKWAFLNIATQLQSTPEWDELLPFSDGWAPVRKGDKWGFINEEGKNKISCQYEATHGFRQAGAPVRKNGKWGIINSDRKEVYALQADQMEFLVQPDHNRQHSSYVLSLVKVEKNGKVGIIDTQGHLVIPCEYDSLEYLPRTGGFKAIREGKEQFVALPDAPSK